MEYKKAINTCVDKFRKQNLDIQHAITNPLKCDYRYVPMKSHVESWSVTAKKATRSVAVMAELPIR